MLPFSSCFINRLNLVPKAAFILSGVMFLGVGCATYRQAPLDEPFVQKALASPDTHVVRMAVAELRHPVLSPVVLDLGDGLSPDEAAVLAVVTNPQLRVMRAGRGIAEAQLIAAGILPNPQLAASADFPVDDTTGASTALGLGLSLDLGGFLSRPAERAAARAGLAQVTLDIAWQEWLVAQATRQQAYNTVFLERQVALAREQEEALQENLRVLTEARKRRLVTQTDRAAAEAAFLQARATRLDLEVQRDTTRQGLLRLLGFPPTANLRLQPTGIPFAVHLDLQANEADTPARPAVAIDTTIIPLLSVFSADTLVAHLERSRLDLVALRYGYESQDASLRAAILRQFPSLNIGLNGARDTGRLLTLGPALSIGLPFFDRNQGEIAVASATREQLRQTYVARLFEARSLVDILLQQLADVQQQLHTAEAAARAQRTLVQTYGAAFRRGDADVLTYYTARTDLIAAELTVVQLRQALANLVVALETATGERIHIP